MNKPSKNYRCNSGTGRPGPIVRPAAPVRKLTLYTCFLRLPLDDSAGQARLAWLGTAWPDTTEQTPDHGAACTAVLCSPPISYNGIMSTHHHTTSLMSDHQLFLTMGCVVRKIVVWCGVVWLTGEERQ